MNLDGQGLDGRAQEALRAVKSDPTDKAALGHLLIALSRAGRLHAENFERRPVRIAFRLEGGLTTRERRMGMCHPWGKRMGRKHDARGAGHLWSKGVWWSVSYPLLTEGAGTELRLIGLEDDGETPCFFPGGRYRFESMAELVEWLGPRLREWRVWTSAERSPFLPPEKCPATLGPTRYPCIFDKGHKDAHAFLGRSG